VINRNLKIIEKDQEDLFKKYKIMGIPKSNQTQVANFPLLEKEFTKTALISTKVSTSLAINMNF